MLKQPTEPANKKIVFFSVNFGRTVHDMVAVYDKRDISDVEALSLIKAEEYSPKVIVITKAQFDNVFRDIIDTPTQKKGEWTMSKKKQTFIRATALFLCAIMLLSLVIVGFQL